MKIIIKNKALAVGLRQEDLEDENIPISRRNGSKVKVA